MIKLDRPAGIMDMASAWFDVTKYVSRWLIESCFNCRYEYFSGPDNAYPLLQLITVLND